MGRRLLGPIHQICSKLHNYINIFQGGKRKVIVLPTIVFHCIVPFSENHIFFNVSTKIVYETDLILKVRTNYTPNSDYFISLATSYSSPNRFFQMDVRIICALFCSR